MMSHCLLNNTHMRKHCLASSISLSISDAISEYVKAITNLSTLTMQYFRQSLCTSVSILHEILQLLYKLIQTQKPLKVSENNWWIWHIKQMPILPKIEWKYVGFWSCVNVYIVSNDLTIYIINIYQYSFSDPFMTCIW
jgi:hypothetical protein